MRFPTALVWSVSLILRSTIQAIRTIVKEEIAESEARTDLKLQILTPRIDEMDKRLTASITSADKRLGFLQILVVALIAAVIGVPAGLFIYLERKAAKGNKESQGEDGSLSQEILAYQQRRSSHLET